MIQGFQFSWTMEVMQDTIMRLPKKYNASSDVRMVLKPCSEHSNSLALQNLVASGLSVEV